LNEIGALAWRARSIDGGGREWDRPKRARDAQRRGWVARGACSAPNPARWAVSRARVQPPRKEP